MMTVLLHRNSGASNCIRAVMKKLFTLYPSVEDTIMACLQSIHTSWQTRASVCVNYNDDDDAFSAVRTSLLCSHLASCVVVSVPTAVGEVRGCLWVRYWFVYVSVWMYTACSSTTLLGLFYFLVAGAAVRSLPAGSLQFVYPWTPAISCPRGEETIGNRMSIPGRRGQRCGRRRW